MSINIHPVQGQFVAEVSGVEIARPLAADTVQTLRDALLAHSILVFRGQRFDDRQHIAFSRYFGDLEIHTQKAWLLPDTPEILALNNRGERGTKPLVNGGAYWHSDITYKARPPMGSLLHAIEVPPEGGDTLFADMCGAYQALDDATKALLEGLHAVHSYAGRYERMAAGDPGRPELTPEQLAEVPDVVHPVVRTHPESGRKALFVNEGFTVQVQGMGRETSRELLERLFAHCIEERFIYRHRWQADDLVFWDNRTTMHCATEYDLRHARNMHRTTILGDAVA